MGPLGWQETVFIFILALLIFGPKKLPELGKTFGKAMTEFRRASSELKATWQREMTAIERESESIKQTTREIANDVSSSYYSNSEYDYDYGYNYDSSSGSTASSSSSTSSTAEDSSTVSASATQGAESTGEGAVVKAAENDTAAPSPESKVEKT